MDEYKLPWDEEPDEVLHSSEGAKAVILSDKWLDNVNLSKDRRVVMNTPATDGGFEGGHRIGKPEGKILNDEFVINLQESPTNEDPFDIEIARSKINGNSVEDLVKQSEGFDVDTEPESAQAITMALQARKLYNTIEKSRKEIIRPHLDFQKALNKMAKDIQFKLKAMEAALFTKVEHFRGKHNERLESIGHKVLPTKVKTDEGSRYETEKWYYEIADFKALEDEYKIIDDIKISEEIKNGVRQIKGLTIKKKTIINYKVSK